MPAVGIMAITADTVSAFPPDLSTSGGERLRFKAANMAPKLVTKLAAKTARAIATPVGGLATMTGGTHVIGGAATAVRRAQPKEVAMRCCVPAAAGRSAPW
jgi:hypothetical protein